MIYLLFSILSASSITLLFKVLERKSVPLLPAIIINYLAAFIVGILFYSGTIDLPAIRESNWFALSGITGVLFILGFFLIGITTQKAGIAITTIANKMSVIIPISFSILYYHEAMTLVKTGGIMLALIAVIMAAYRKPALGKWTTASFLPLIMFLVVGGIDSVIKLAQESYVPANDVSLFSALTFGSAGIIGIILLLFKPGYWKSFNNAWLWGLGTALGLANFGSMFFLMNALNHAQLDSSIVYGVNHLGVILVSILLALLLFHERLSLLNRIGILLAAVAISILTMLV